MVIIRARFPQHWRGNYYEQDEKMPATEEQGRRLTQADVAYYDFEDEVPTMSNTKKEIEAYLDAKGLEYDEYATKSELLELIDGN